MKKSLKISIYSVIGLILIAAAIGYYFYQKPVKNFAESEADIVLNAVDLFNEFTADEQGAIKKYVSDDKTIQVNGKIMEISKNSDGTATILLEAGSTDGDISCSLVSEESSFADQYTPGQSITIKGQCTGLQELINKEVVMIRCGIVRDK